MNLILNEPIQNDPRSNLHSNSKHARKNLPNMESVVFRQPTPTTGLIGLEDNSTMWE
jgi:hypothetical protein